MAKKPAKGASARHSKAASLKLKFDSSRVKRFTAHIFQRGDVDMSAITDFFAPLAMEAGEKRGREEERELANSRYFESMRGNVVRRFGSCPDELDETLRTIDDPDLQFDFVSFVKSTAKSLSDVVTKAKLLPASGTPRFS